MKYILSFILSVSLLTANAQFPGTDSLRNFNNRFITNEAMRAFTNLRLHNLLSGMIDFIDSARGGSAVFLGVDTMYVTADSIFHYKKNGVFRQFVIRGRQGAGRIYEVPYSDGNARFANDSNFRFDLSQGANNSRLIVGPTAINDGGLSKLNATSDNMNAASFSAFGTGTNTVIFRRALGSVGLPLAITSGTDLWNFSGRGYTGSVYTTSRANIYARSTQDWTDTTHGTKIVFGTTHNDSSVMRDRMTLDQDGRLVLHNYKALAQTIDTNLTKPMAIDTFGNIYKFAGWSGVGSVGTFIAGNTTPDNSLGANGNYYFEQNKSRLYKKAAGAWSVLGYLRSDTIVPITPRDTLYMTGTIADLGAAWDARAQPYNEGSYFKNPNAIGNTALQFRDDAVRFSGWNVNGLGTRIRPLEAANYLQHESHYDTRQIGDSAYEHHKVHLFVPGSPGAIRFPSGIRVWSENTSKSQLFSQIYYTGNEFKWKWQKSDAGAIYDWMTAYPGGLELTMPIKIDSIAANGGVFLAVNNKNLWKNEVFGGRSYSLLTNNVGLRDTMRLFNDAGHFYFKNETSTGYTLFDNPGGIYLVNGSTGIWSVSSNGDLAIASQAGFSSSYNVNFHNNAYGITLNKTPDRNSYIDIASDPVSAASYNNYFRFNITDNDSVGNPLRLIFEKQRGNSFTHGALSGTKGYEIYLNDVHSIGTEHTTTTLPDGRYTADFVVSSKYSGPRLERFRITDTGYVKIKSLQTGITAPTTSGTTKVVVSDANGLLSNIAISSLPNFANTDLTFTGNRLHNAAGNYLTIDSLNSMNLISRGLAASFLRRTTRLHKDASISSDLQDHAYFGSYYLKADGVTDSITMQMAMNGASGIRTEYVNGNQVARLSLYKQHAQLRADSVYLSAIPAATADTVAAFGAFDAASKTRPALAVPMLKFLKGSTTWQPGVVAAGSSATTTLTLTGAVTTDVVHVNKVTGGLSNGEVYDAWVSASNTVTIRVHNVSTGSANYNTTETYNVVLLKY